MKSNKSQAKNLKTNKTRKIALTTEKIAKIIKLKMKKQHRAKN